jgi:hypothetical protein
MTWIAAAISGAAGFLGTTGGAILGSSVIGAGASLLGGGSQSGAIEQGAAASIAEQRRQFDIAQQFNAPRIAAEDAAREQLMNVLGLGSQPFDFSSVNIPGQQFAIDESQRAVERSAAARGGLVSGNTLAELQNRALGITNQNFTSNFLNPLVGLASGGAGQTAGQQALQLGVNVGNTQQNLATNRSNIIGQQFSGVNQAVQGGLSNYLLNQQLNRPPITGGVV